MGGLAESNAGHDAAAMMSQAMSAAGYTPKPPLTPLQCTNAAMECRQVVAELNSTKSRFEVEIQKMAEDRERLLALEAVLTVGEVGGDNSLNMLRIKKMQEIDIIQRNNIYELEKTLSDYKRELADLKNGNTESKALGKLNQIEVLLRQVPHAPMCKVDAGVPCVCHHKAIRAVYDSTAAPVVPSGITAQTIFNV